MSAPPVTVIIPTYNWATVLPCSIGSALDQTFADFELLVIGDACTDETEAVVRDLAARDARVRWDNRPVHAGHQYVANNHAMHQARGGIVAYLGHDDLWLPRHLELLVGVLRDDADAGVAHGRMVMVNPRRVPFAYPHVSWSYRRSEWMPPTSTAYRTAALRRVGGWRAPVDTATLDPETDLCARVTDIFGHPILVPHVTSMKFPASYRRDVYISRPNHEQAAWLARIRDAADPEALLLALCAEVGDVRVGGIDEEDDPVDRLEPTMRPSVAAIDRYRTLRQHKGLG